MHVTPCLAARPLRGKTNPRGPRESRRTAPSRPWRGPRPLDDAGLNGDQIASRVALVAYTGKVASGRRTERDFHRRRISPGDTSMADGYVVSHCARVDGSGNDGLEPQRHVIIEIATLITDDDLNVIAEGPDLVIHASPEQMGEMGDFVTEMHTKSGLIDAVNQSTVTTEEAENQTLAFFKEHIAEAARFHSVAIRSVPNRRFLQEYMPTLEEFSTTATWTSRR